MRSRVVALWGRVVAWRIPEPKHISIILAVVYAGAVGTGVVTLVSPPERLVGVVGLVSMALVGWFFIIGGFVGMWAGTGGNWQLERVGLSGMAVGVLTYAYILLSLHVTVEESKLTPIGVTLVLGLGFIVLRLGMIWRYDFKPRE